MSGQSESIELATPCGLYCGACTVFKARGDTARTEKIAQAMGIPVEQVNCRGCRAEKGLIKFMGEPCPTYECLAQKGLQFCYECEDFPCLKLAPCADKAQSLPHNTKIYNLVLLQKLGFQKWLPIAQQTWRRYFTGKKEHGGAELKV